MESSLKPRRKGVARIVHATSYSLRGLAFAVRNESAFRQELVGTAILLPFAVRFGRSPTEVALLGGSLFLVLITELVNTAIEAVVDRIGPERHELAGVAKDLGSAAVFVSLLGMAFTWATVFLAP